MLKVIVAAFFTFTAAPWTLAQMPPPPEEDFPKPLPPEGKKKAPQETQDPNYKREGVKPPLPITPPDRDPLKPDELEP